MFFGGLGTLVKLGSKLVHFHRRWSAYGFEVMSMPKMCGTSEPFKEQIVENEQDVPEAFDAKDMPKHDAHSIKSMAVKDGNR